MEPSVGKRAASSHGNLCAEEVVCGIMQNSSTAWWSLNKAICGVCRETAAEPGGIGIAVVRGLSHWTAYGRLRGSAGFNVWMRLDRSTCSAGGWSPDDRAERVAIPGAGPQAWSELFKALVKKFGEISAALVKGSVEASRQACMEAVQRRERQTRLHDQCPSPGALPGARGVSVGGGISSPAVV